MLKKIGVLTSGGDSPGMNACIRAIVRSAVQHNIQTIGFIRGYEGLIDDHSTVMSSERVSGIIQRGGTILKTARSERFHSEEGRKMAARTIRKNKLGGLIVIGGDGTFRGAIELEKLISIPILGCAGTIDNDLVGTDFTIGYDTAINTAVDAIDKIRDTAESHDRIFVVEVMGRDAGLIALRSAIACGAEALLVPEIKNDLKALINKILGWRKTKSSRIIIVAEGDESGGAFKVADFVKQYCPEFDIRVSILGHIQRGGNPTCMERVNASIVGYNAVNGLIKGRTQEMVGIINKKVVFTPFRKAVKHHRELRKDLAELIYVLGS